MRDIRSYHCSRCGDKVYEGEEHDCSSSVGRCGFAGTHEIYEAPCYFQRGPQGCMRPKEETCPLHTPREERMDVVRKIKEKYNIQHVAY